VNQSENRNTLIFRIAAGLLLAVLLTMRMFAGVPARYSTNAQGSDGARVARYALTVTESANKNLVLDCTNGKDVSGNYTFTVSNRNANGVCEVAMDYRVVVTLPSALLQGMTLTLGGNAAESITNGGKTHIFNGNTTFSAGVEKTFTETLTFTVTSAYDGFTYVDLNQVSQTVPTTTAVYYLDGIQIDVVSEQID